MKRFSFVFLILLISCSSHQPQQSQTPLFVQEKVCAQNALDYLNNHPAATTAKRYTPEEIRPYTLNLAPMVKACYEKEMGRTGQNNSFNLCLVIGLDKKGTKEFFEFSTSEIPLTAEMKQCLGEIKSKADFGKLKDVSIVQSYNLYPSK